MKLSHITNSAFNIAVHKLMGEPLPLRVAFKLKGIVARIAEEAKKYEEVRWAALEKYGSKDDSGNLLLHEDESVQLSPENMEKFRAELEQLHAVEIDVPTINLDELGDLKLTTQDVMALEPLLQE